MALENRPIPHYVRSGGEIRASFSRQEGAAMRFEPFLLDQWIERKFSGEWKINHDFTASSGPSWKLRELLELDGGEATNRLLDVPVTYPSAAGSLELRKAIAEWQGVSAADVQIVTGAQEALLAIFFCAAAPDANVVVPQPGFPAFSALPRGFGLEVRHYRLLPENGFQIDPSEVEALVDRRTALVLVNSPHNPTGTVLTEACRRELHDFCADRDVQFVCDQVFHPHYYDASVTTAAALPYATVVGDLSKALCLPGLRVGWIIERDHERLERYRETRMYCTISNGPLTESLAELAIRRRDLIYARAQTVSRKNLEMIEAGWPREDDTVRWIRPDGGFTVFPWFPDVVDTRPLCERLGARGLLVVPGDCFGMPEHIRVGFGTEREGFGEAFDALRTEIRVYLRQERQGLTVTVP
jgi:aspartate/methionine/tyrosine aminotransferase